MSVSLQILQKLQADPLAKHPAAAEALSELSVLFKLLGHMQGLQHIDFNMSLARGLDYYTGVIYEAVMLKSWNGGNPQVGSVAAGGRSVTPLLCSTCEARLCGGGAAAAAFIGDVVLQGSAAVCIACAVQCLGCVRALLSLVNCCWFLSRLCSVLGSELTMLYLGTYVTSTCK